MSRQDPDEFRISKVESREVLDSRGNPTVQVDVQTKGRGFGRFTVPSGASKGRFEAYELRDGDARRYLGLGVQRAVENVKRILGPAVQEFDSREQHLLDEKILELDGTERKEKLGANALLGVSMATARAAGDTMHLPFYRYLHLKTANSTRLLPVPMMNIINGGKHAGNDLAFQEFMILPTGLPTFREALRAGSEIYHILGKSLAKKYGKSATNVGDEGGYAPPITRVREALEAVNHAVEEAGYKPGRDVVLGVDPASGSFYDEARQVYKVDGREFRADQLLRFYDELVEAFPLKSIEDPFHDDDFENFATITRDLQSRRVQIVGDDLFVTNSKRLERGIRQHAANAILLKVNQAGTLTETLDTVSLARKANYGLVISHRSGDTEDTSVADLAVGLSTGQIKTGALARGERTAKYNRLLQIEEELGNDAYYYGPMFLQH